MAEQLIIPEDPRLSQRIRQAAAGGTLGHAVILSGEGDLLRAAGFLAAAMECTGQGAPCSVCPACQKVLRDIHPDVTYVRDSEHKNISMDVLRQVRADAYIMPNEGRRRIYIFPSCELLDPKTQNVLLKVLEEGPPQAAFIFCARNSASLLQTIRSRAVEWKLRGEARPVGEDENARLLCRLLAEKRCSEITAFCTDLENSKLSREELQRLLSAGRDLLVRALAACYGTAAADGDTALLARALGRQKLARLSDILQEFIRQCGYNIGAGHLTGALAVALTDCLRA